MAIKLRVEDFFVLAVVGFFVCLRLSSLSFHFGDGNAYFYMAKAMSAGQWPYRDFFLADPPALVGFLSILSRLIGGNYIVFQAVPVLLEALTAVVLYLLARRATTMGFLAPLLYLFSFSVLATSDYCTGVQLAVLVMTAGVYFAEKQNGFLSGVFWAVGVLTKLYILPFFLAFLIVDFFARQREILKILFAAAVVAVLVLGPFFLLAPDRAMADVIFHHLSRPGGLDKEETLAFFLATRVVFAYRSGNRYSGFLGKVQASCFTHSDSFVFFSFV